MQQIDKRQRRLMRTLTVTLLVLADLLLIRLDYITGPFLPFTVFYIALLFFAMTRVGSTWAYLIALLSAAGRTYTVSQTVLHGAHASFIAWQFATSFSVLALICFLLDRRRYRKPRNAGARPAPPVAAADEAEQDRRFTLFTGQTDRHISMMILSTLGFLAAFVPWIHNSSTPEPYCMSADNGKLIENPRTATPAQADAAMHTRVLLLTIDDGPTRYEADNSILDTLDRHLAKSIWFLNCRGFDPAMDPHAAQNLLTLHRLVKDGHIIANHTYNHPNLVELDKTDPMQVRREITQCTTAIRNAAATPPVYFRAPFGAFPPDSIQIAAQDGMSVMRWNASFDSLFGFQRASEEQAVQVPADAMKHFVDALQNGDIILIHDHLRSAVNLEAFMSLAEKRGFSFALPGHELSSEALAKATPRLGDPNND